MKYGHCTKYPADECTKATSQELIPMPTPDAKCPECGSDLILVKNGGGGNPEQERKGPAIPPIAWIVGGCAAIVGVVAGGIILLGKPATPTGPGLSCVTDSSPAFDLRLSGSNTIGAALAPELVKAWLKSKGGDDAAVQSRCDDKHNPIDESVVTAHVGGKLMRVEVKAHGSATAFSDLDKGDTDIGLASRRIKPEEVTQLSRFGDMRSGASEHVLALDGVAVVVPQSNPITQITRADLRRIFSGQVQNWSEVGGPNLPISIFARDDKSGTYDTFKSLVLDPEKLDRSAARIEDSAKLEAAVAASPGGIGFIGLPYVKTTRALAIQDGTATPFQPTTFSVKTESYVLSRRLYLYTPQNPARNAGSLVSDFVTFALATKGGQPVVQDLHFVDLVPIQMNGGSQLSTTAGPCALSDRYPFDRQSFCRLRDTTHQLDIAFKFDSGKADLDNRATRDLQRVLEILEKDPSKQIILAGFADSRGPYPINCALSKNRAERVAAALKTLGLTVKNTFGFCQELPIRDNADEQGREQNRRVEIFLQ